MYKITEQVKQLCSLDVLGLADKPKNDQGIVYQEFKEQLQRNEGQPPWKANHPELPKKITATCQTARARWEL